jgi:hypothetical protein
MDDLSQKLSTVWGRDKYLALINFLPMILAAPAAGAGMPKLSQKLNALATTAGDYRAISRFTLSLDAVWTKARLDTLSRAPPGVAGALTYLAFFFDAAFAPFEHVAVLAKHGIISNVDDRSGRYGGLAVLCWFWGLVLKIYSTVRELVAAGPAARSRGATSSDMYRDNAVKRLRLTLVKLVCFCLLAWSLLPKTGARLLAKPGGPLFALHKLLAVMTPRPIPLTGTAQGILGFTASVLDLM